jgi:hypothetical protein
VRQRVDDSRLLEQGRARLGRRSSIFGPFELDDDTAVAVQVPLPWSLAYALDAPVERDAAAFDDMADPVQRAWWMRLFPDGRPFREEGDVVDLGLSLARRFGGALRVGRRPVLAEPDPARLVDLTVWSAYWLSPERLLELMAPLLPGAAVDLGGGGWAGPADPGDHPLEPLDPALIDAAHATDEALRTAAAVVGTANDVRALAGPDVLDGYELRAASDVRVAVMHEDHVPAWVRRRLADVLARPDGPVVTFGVGWSPADPLPLEAEQPPPAVRLARERVRPRVRAAARVLAEVTAGVVTDADGFELDRYTLR